MIPFGNRLCNKKHVSVSFAGQHNCSPNPTDRKGNSIYNKKQLQLYGHIKRATLEVSRIYFEGMVKGRRNRGRTARWRDKEGIVEGRRNRGRTARRWRDKEGMVEWTDLIRLNAAVKSGELWRRISQVGAQLPQAETANDDNDDKVHAFSKSVQTLWSFGREF